MKITTRFSENRLFEIRYNDGTTRRVEATSTEELSEKALDYYKAKAGTVDFHWVQVHPVMCS